MSEATFTKKLRVTVSPYLVLSVPKDIIDMLGLKAGDYIEVHIKVKRRAKNMATIFIRKGEDGED